MAHLGQKLFQLGAVSLQLCNLMAQASHRLRMQHLLSHPSRIPYNCSRRVNGVEKTDCTGLYPVHVL